MTASRLLMIAVLAGIQTPDVGFCENPAGGEAARRMEVALAVHPEVAERSAWRGVVKQALAEATNDWGELCGLRFSVTGESVWDPGPVGGLSDVAAAWEERCEDASGRLALVVVPEAPGAADELLGYALLARPVVIVRFVDAKRLKVTLRHELGHAFGLPHLPGRNIMAESFEERSWEFDTIATDVLRAAAGMDFGSAAPFTGCDLDVLRDAYAAWARRGVGEPLLARKLAEAFEAAGRGADAARCREIAARLAR